MSRIVSVWLKAWPIARLLLSQRSGARAEPVAAQRPLVLVAPGKGGARITAHNRAAPRSPLDLAFFFERSERVSHRAPTYIQTTGQVGLAWEFAAGRQSLFSNQLLDLLADLFMNSDSSH